APIAHLPLDGPPVLMGLHWPLGWLVSAIAHDMQRAVHAVSQQIPATHWPWTHSLLPMQVEPSIFLVAQVPAAPPIAVQYPLVQVGSVGHVVAHPVVVEHVKPWQSCEIAAMQFPWPSHVLGGVKEPPAHVAARHVVALPYFSQAPLPSQWLVFPHDPGV